MCVCNGAGKPGSPTHAPEIVLHAVRAAAEAGTARGGGAAPHQAPVRPPAPPPGPAPRPQSPVQPRPARGQQQNPNRQTQQKKKKVQKQQPKVNTAKKDPWPQVINTTLIKMVSVTGLLGDSLYRRHMNGFDRVHIHLHNIS